MSTLGRYIRFSGFFVALLLSPSLFGSDTILIHGHIYTGNPFAPWVQALAITGDHIDAVGTDREISSRREAKTKVIDLQGRTVIPGIIDSHTHMMFGAMEIHGFNLSTPGGSITAADPATLIAKIKSFAASHPKDKILFGRADFSTVLSTAPTHELLDGAVSDRPIVIHNISEHALWLNARALALAGVSDKPVADPAQEKYVFRHANGHPTGILLEGAMELMEQAVSAYLTFDDKLAMLRDASHYLNRYGLTSVVNATGSLAELQLYAALRDRGELTVRTRTAFGAVAMNHHLTPKFLSDLEQARTTYHDDWVSADLVKFFADGATGPIPPLMYESAEYARLVAELDKRHYQLMTHATRTDTTQMVLDAYQGLEKANGPRDRRLRMEHAFIVSPQDVPRFAKLSVVVSMQPVACCSTNGSNNDPTDRTITDRWQTYARTGAVLAFGSDWPCNWPPDPFAGIQEAVTRHIWQPDAATRDIPGMGFDGAGQAGATETPEIYSSEERLTVAQALNAYTQGSAYAEFADDRLGTLDPGKEADLVILSQDIFSVRPDDIAKTRVVMTMVAGRTVYRGENGGL